jgi:hypothetical protein
MVIENTLLLSFASGFSSAATAAILHFVVKGRFRWEGSIIELVNEIMRLLSIPLFLLGLLMFVLSNILWLLVLGEQKLSIAFPLQVALVLILNTAISTIIFNETISVSGYWGIVFVIVGTALITR